ncbi:hypothetical protein [Peribacillus asahii]|uniref:hypothetical protein n=1 Tax=Peribacillus asahii TaxID=228899 RepID=UPI00207A5D3D|nr:hypothetical protein [Peribacillus asahii]USK85744.1 hypothetical protein LIT35_03495 [Peribacillus asahii]
MKKILIIGATALFLAACGDEEATKPAEEPKQEESKQEEITKNEDEMSESEWMEQQAKKEVVVSENESMEPIGVYTNEETDEEGFFKVDYEGFILKISPKLVNAIPLSPDGISGKALKIDMQTENTRDGDVDYNGGITIITDTKEQISPESGLMSDNPVIQTYMGQVKEEGYSLAALKDNESTPQKITLILDAPYEVVDGTVDPVNGVLGEEEKRIEFTLEEYQQKEME